MVDGDAFASAALPDPLVDPDAPWMYWDRRVLLPASDSKQQISLDVKAQRKFAGNDRELVFVIDNDDATETIEWVIGVRVLLALP